MAADDAGVRAQVRNAVVRLLSAEQAERSTASRSRLSDLGLLVSDRGHVVGNIDLATRTRAVVAIMPDGSRHSGKVLARDDATNLALFHFPSLDQPPPARAAGPARDGDGVYSMVAMQDGRRGIVATSVIEAERVVRRSADAVVLPFIEIADDGEMPVLGPVFDDRGAVLGFVTYRSAPGSKTPRVEAMAIADVMRIADELRVAGRVRRSRLGLGVQEAPDRRGALVGSVSKGGPADRAGLAPRDVLTHIESPVYSSPIGRRDDYFIAMNRIRAGTHVRLTFRRDGIEKAVDVVTGEVVRPAPDPRKRLPS